MDTKELHPERLIIRGLRLVKSRARRGDTVGDVAHRTLELVHDGLGATVKSLGRIHEESEPPARAVARRSTARRRTATS